MRNVKNPSEFRIVAEKLHILGPRILAANGKDIKFGCTNKEYQHLYETGVVTNKRSSKENFEPEKEAHRYAMWKKIIAQAKLLTEHGGGHIPITKLEGSKKGGWL